MEIELKTSEMCEILGNAVNLSMKPRGNTARRVLDVAFRSTLVPVERDVSKCWGDHDTKSKIAVLCPNPVCLRVALGKVLGTTLQLAEKFPLIVVIAESAHRLVACRCQLPEETQPPLFGFHSLLTIPTRNRCFVRLSSSLASNGTRARRRKPD
jgi:hypothetical protein